jgi:short-subunit dehydrogenase
VAAGWAVVTGASSGIGREFARTLAGRGYSVLLVARRQERLEELARELPGSMAFAADLESLEGARLVAEKALSLGPVAMLVNCAGFGNYGSFTEQPSERTQAEIRVNCAALVELTQRVLPSMVQRGDGRIINIASTLGLQPVPYFSVYGATKAFVISFSEAIAQEYGERGIGVTVVCPGPVRTEFAEQASLGSVTDSIPNLTPQEVVTAAMAASDRGTSFTVPGLVNKVQGFLPRITPRRAMRGIMAVIFKPSAR